MEFKEVLKTSGMSLKQFSELFGIPYRTIQDWNASKRTPPEYVLNLIIEKLNEKKEKEKGVITMKKVKIYEYIYERTNGDCFSEFAFSLDEIRTAVFKDAQTLTGAEKESSTRKIVGYEITLPGDYVLPNTAEQLTKDLFNGDVESENYDVCCGFTDNSQIFLEEITE